MFNPTLQHTAILHQNTLNTFRQKYEQNPLIKLLNRVVENIVPKGENVHYEQAPLLAQ